MPYEAVRSISLPVNVTAATADIPQRRFVNFVAGGLRLPAASGDAVGVTLELYDDSEFDAGNASDVIPVALLDGARIEVEAGAAVAIGARVMANVNGQAITAAGATARVLGIAQTAAAAAGEVITIIGLKAAGEFVT